MFTPIEFTDDKCLSSPEFQALFAGRAIRRNGDRNGVHGKLVRGADGRILASWPDGSSELFNAKLTAESEVYMAPAAAKPDDQATSVVPHDADASARLALAMSKMTPAQRALVMKYTSPEYKSPDAKSNTPIGSREARVAALRRVGQLASGKTPTDPAPAQVPPGCEARAEYLRRIGKAARGMVE